MRCRARRLQIPRAALANNIDLRESRLHCLAEPLKHKDLCNCWLFAKQLDT